MSRPDQARGSFGGEAIAVSSLLLLSASVVAVFFGAYQLLETTVLRRRFDLETLQILHTIRGITGSMLVAVFVAYYMIRHPHAGFSARDAASVIDRQKRQIEHVRWFVQMRWVAAAFTLALIIIAVPLTAILSVRHLPLLFLWLLVLIAANLYFASQIDSGVSADTQIITQVVIDLIILTGLLNASGGIENPLSIAYLFHVIIAGILLPRRKAIGVALAASGFFCVLSFGELLHVLPHSAILLFPHGPEGHEHAAHNVLFVAGHTVSFTGVMLLTAYFTTLVTDRLHRSESELESAARAAVLDRRRLEGVIDAAGLGMVVVGRDLVVQWFNQRVAQWLGWTDRDAERPLAHTHDVSGGCLACLTAETFADGVKHETEVCSRRNGDGARYFRYVVSPIRDVAGQTVQVVDVVEDITERKALEAEALHASRLSVLGQLAAGVAHEIGNPLSSLHARLQLMKRRPDPEFARDSIDILQTQIDRIGRIVRGVSNLARKPGDIWTAIDLNTVVREAVALVKFDKRAANVAFEDELRRLPQVDGVHEQILQVLINLLLNAVESMPGGGTVRIASFDRENSVCVSISDSGGGIEESVRSRLFEPFFTTKASGTGLGLSICYSLVHAHGGTIEVRSEEGSGSCFTVVLPPRRAHGVSPPPETERVPA